MKLAIGAGHGLHTAGKRVPKELDKEQTREWVLNDRVVRYTIDLLGKYKIDILRTDDPTGKVDVSLRNRANKANNWKADLYISIHHNAGIYLGLGGGVTVYRYPNSTKTSHTLAQSFYNEIVGKNNLKGNRASPINQANFQILRQTTMTALLLENGFMDSRTDYPIITTDDHARKTAEGIVNFLVKNYKLEKKTGNDYKELYRVVVEGKAVGSYAVKANALRQVERAIDNKVNKIELVKVRLDR